MKITRRITENFGRPITVSKDTEVQVLDGKRPDPYRKKLIETGFFKEGDILNTITYFEAVDDDGKEIRGLMITT